MATTLTNENREYVPKVWDTVPCPFCGAHAFKSHEKFGPENRYTYVQCLDCDLVYSSPRPRYDEEFINAAYSVYDTSSHHLKNRGELSDEERVLVDRYKITVRQITRHFGGVGRILDVGCGTGLFLLAAKEEGWNPVGIDISRSMTTAAKEYFGIPAFCGQYHETNVAEDGLFDVIYCSHVIEHIPNPNEWMAKFRRDLKPNGILCLNVPNQYSIDRRVKRGFKMMGFPQPKWALWRTPDHLYEPHMRPMKYLLEKHGFDLVEAFTYSKRERSPESVGDKLFHHAFKVGSKLRFFARPSTLGY